MYWLSFFNTSAVTHQHSDRVFLPPTTCSLLNKIFVTLLKKKKEIKKSLLIINDILNCLQQIVIDK